MISRRLYEKTGFVLENAVDKMLQLRKLTLAPHTLDLFNHFMNIMDNPSSMVSFYREYRALLVEKSERLGLKNHELVAWLSQHCVGEDIYGRKF